MCGVFSSFHSLFEFRPISKSESYSVSLQRPALLWGTAIVLTQIAYFKPKAGKTGFWSGDWDQRLQQDKQCNLLCNFSHHTKMYFLSWSRVCIMRWNLRLKFFENSSTSKKEEPIQGFRISILGWHVTHTLSQIEEVSKSEGSLSLQKDRDSMSSRTPKDKSSYDARK